MAEFAQGGSFSDLVNSYNNYKEKYDLYHDSKENKTNEETYYFDIHSA